MIQEIHIKTLEELMPLLSEQEDRPDLGRNRSPYVYRGMTNADFRMVTSLRRNCKQLQQTLEPAILKNFAKYAVIEDPGVSQSVWHQMILGQHHGLPTRLLDWTQSALVALHFAMSEENLEHMADHDCMVWRIDIRELHALLPENYQQVMRQYQAEVFSVVPMEMENVEDFLQHCTQNSVKYVIDRSLRWRVRDMLDQLNMSERIVYPGLDGLSRWIARHYYVKDS